MPPSDWSVVLIMIGSTVLVCLLGYLTAAYREWLKVIVQLASGIVVPPLIMWCIFSYWGSFQGTHSSFGLLLLAWVVCVAVGGVFGYRSMQGTNDDPQA